MNLSQKAEMTCRELVELVTEYLEGTLSAEDRERFEEHLTACPWCVNYLEQIELTVRTLGRLDEHSLSAEAREALLAAFRDWKRSGAS
jgi:anti-sigma factor RsiW